MGAYMSSIHIKAGREFISSEPRRIPLTKLCLLWGDLNPSTDSVYFTISTDCNEYL